jgi:hypothetical protein
VGLKRELVVRQELERQLQLVIFPESARNKLERSLKAIQNEN